MKLILIHNKLIFDQLVKMYKELGIEVGEIRHDKMKLGKITIAMEKTFMSRYKSTEAIQQFTEHIGLLVVDEVHLAAGLNYQNVLDRIPAYNRIGFSGTALAGNQKQIRAITEQFGSVITEITNEEMIEKGVSSPVTVEVHDIAYSKFAAFDNYNTLLRTMYNSKARLEVMKNVLQYYKKNILIFVSTVEQGEVIEYWLRDAGFVVKFIHGDLAMKDKTDSLTNFGKGHFDALISTSIIQEGVNIKDIRTLIFAAAGKSVIKVKQVIGRGLRKKEFDNDLTVVEFNDKVKGFDKQSEARIETYKAENFKIIYK